MPKFSTPWGIHEARLDVLERRREALDYEIAATKRTIDLCRSSERQLELSAEVDARAVAAIAAAKAEMKK